MLSRRNLIKTGLSIPMLAPMLGASNHVLAAPEKFSISLAQWSLHRTYYGEHAQKGYGHLFKLLQSDPAAAVSTGPDPMDFPILARNEFGIGAVEYVNQFYFAQIDNESYFKEMAQKAVDHGVVSHLMMLDGTGPIGATDPTVSAAARENVKRWMGQAQILGCSMVRVNAEGEGEWHERAKRTADALDQLAVLGESMDLAVVVENHGGLSSNGAWLAEVMSLASHPGVGTLPDFGNFRTGKDEAGDDIWYDRYQGVRELMPFAKAVSAKSYDFDESGNDTATDYQKMMKIVLDAGYTGYVGIEYEGRGLSEYEGIRATKRLLESIQAN